MNFDHLAMPKKDQDGADEASNPTSAPRLTVRWLPADPVAQASEQHARMAEACADLARLGHPNIVPVLECGRQGNRAFVSTPLTESEPLAQFRARVGRLPALQSLAFAAQLLSALEAAHRHGLVHLALSPDMLQVTRRGQLQVEGFGWAALMASGGAELSPYSTPEQRRGERADHRADLYSAAVVIHELLAHALPVRWQQDNAGPGSRSREQHIGDAPHARLTPELQAVFRRALAANPRARYASAGDFYAALQSALGAPVWERPAAPPGVKPARAHQRLVAAAQALLRRSWLDDGSPGSMADRAGLALAAACAIGVVLAANAILGQQPARNGQQAVMAAGLVDRSAKEAPPARRWSGRTAPLHSSGGPPAAPRVEPLPLVPQSPASGAAGEQENTQAREAGDSRGAVVSGSRAVPGGDAERVSPRRPPQVAARSSRVSDGERTRSKGTGFASLDCSGEESMPRELCQVLRCATAEFRRHPQCVRLHAEGRSRLRVVELAGAP